MNIKTLISSSLLAVGILLSSTSQAADYVVDTRGMHAAVQFRVKHLGYSWLHGRFNDFSGQFSFDESNPSGAKIAINIETTSLDSNHAERDKHLRSDDFLDTSEFPEASFVSTSSSLDEHGNGSVTGNFTLRGITKPITIIVSSVGAGDDPWGGFRRGFEGTTEFQLKDFGIDYDLGPASASVYLTLSVEGIRQ